MESNPWMFITFLFHWSCFLPETAAAGLCFLQYCNLNTRRSKFILGISLFLGLSIPQYFREFETFYGFGPAHTRSLAVCRLNYRVTQPSYYKYNFHTDHDLNLILSIEISVQCHCQRDILLARDCCCHTCLPSRLHAPLLGTPCEEGQGLAVVGEIQVLQAWWQKRGVLRSTIWYEQVLPLALGEVTMRGWSGGR